MVSLFPTTLFVLLWSSGALFVKAGLAYASPFAFLALRLVLALALVSVLAARRGRWLPRRGTTRQVAATGLRAASVSPAGVACALAALAALTAGTWLQKRSQQEPLDVLPLQFAVGLAACAAMLPFEAVRVAWTPAFVITLAWLGVVISVLATLLLYRLLAAGNVVDVTSLFYLVPAGTAVLDWLVFGTVPAPLALAGMAATLAGLVVVFRSRAGVS